MTYNIHPILVHFPIAFLFLYSVIKILPFSKWFPRLSWKQMEQILLATGVIGAVLASSTGEIAQNITHPNRSLVEMHSLFAGISTTLYAILLGGEILPFIISFVDQKIHISGLTKFLTFLQEIISQRTLSKLLAFLGLVAISVTGLLGGVMVYGVSADPIAGTVLNVLGLQR